ncbi:alpha/beta hydrolase [Streptomyces sp. NPDC057689]|uniref:alpha/beta hydrolase n=1 Tax=Streptomyces sp. NPDC057689 TaxID=3346213 RepID=UPI003698FCAA
MDLATLKALKPSEFENAADGYRATAAMADAAKDTVDNQISAGINHQLKGATATAALRELAAVSRNFQYVQTECGLVSTALNGFAFDMASAKRKLEAAIEDARADHCTVHADGSVGYPAGRKPGEEKDTAGGTVTGSAGSDPTADALERQAANIHPNPYYGVAIEYADRIADALREATEADAKWEPKLRALRADDDLVVSNRDWTDVTSDRGGVTDAADTYLDSIKPPPKEATPEESAAWWKSLTPEQQADYLAVHPNAIGAMNGLPSDIRDDANRMVLDETRAKYQLDLNTIPKEPVKYAPNTNGSYPAAVITPEWRQWNDKYGAKKDRLEGALKGMQAIQDRFDRTGEKGLPEAYLLGFDPTGLGDGRIILANGNPDTADHVGVWVPGTKASLESTRGDLGRAEGLWSTSQKFSGDEKISTILWLDYNAPDNIPQATRGGYAEEGGPRLHDFLEGNRVAQETTDGARSHTTVLGHSYGSTVVGVSTQWGSWQDPQTVDDYVFAGSPGVQADQATDLGVRGDHVWAMSADAMDDRIVREGGRAAGLGDNWVIPTDESFGGNIMKSDAHSHKEFYDEGSLSLRNQAAVIAGAYDKVKLEQ